MMAVTGPEVTLTRLKTEIGTYSKTCAIANPIRIASDKRLLVFVFFFCQYGMKTTHAIMTPSEIGPELL